MKKRLLTICISAFLLFCGLAFASCGEKDTSGLEFKLVNGTYTVVGIGSNEDGDLVIPSKYKGKAVTAIGAEAFKGEVEIGHVTIPDSVTSIGTMAFYSCPNLTKVTIGKNVETIADNAFAYCPTLDTLTLSEELVTIGDSAFFGCARLKTLAFPDTLKTIANNAFNMCRKLETVTFGNSLETIGVRAFYNCELITGVEIPDGARTDVMDEAFFGCASLEHVRLGKDVINIGPSAFEGGGQVREIVIGDGVFTIGARAFAGCRKAYVLTLGASITSIGHEAFNKCTLMHEIENRSGITINPGTTGNGEVGYYAWYVRRPNEPTRLSKDDAGIVYYTEGDRKVAVASHFKTHTAVVIPDDVTEIGEYAFYNEQLITSVVIGDGCVKIGGSAFRNSYKIESVVMGKNVTTIAGNAFRYNGYIVTLVIGKNLKTVGSEAFMKKVGDRYYKPYKNVFFEGTQAEWDSVTFADGNDHLINAGVTIAFYSEEEPTLEGSYWHYVEGKPTLWTTNS